MQNVIVPINAFDRFEVLKKGQTSFIRLIAESGAFGIEIRRELLSEQDPPLDSMRKEIEQYQLFTVYSAPIELWKRDHGLNEKELNEIFHEGIALGAKWIKVSLGHFHKGQSSVRELDAFLNQHQGIQLLVENDQTLHGGNINQLTSFFESASEQDAPVKMTFDAGNWYYSGQDVDEALSKLSPYVHYLHLKQVEDDHGEFITVPLQKDGSQSWEKVMKSLPSEIVKALEFPIEPKEKTKEFIQMITESEALSCNS
ncbi:sugar phosphate isomerase/epimerase [Bacillus sp. AFS031507]|uniref:sugar phosphate isomerase/epimerase family protein n=1 Tax=Bacillus sp. AFS031507 TaxID=2033496 RepID=UPI000BFE2695|nr:sugar phosphate isomerase/epimerase [Bacillus sp. AFS031507]PGY09632.1 xylose isomerase [Bacillus sp. AFS031507]